MNIDIQTRGFSLTDSLASHVKKRLRTLLQINERHVLTAGVRLFDINGPRGGVDKRCVLMVALPGNSNVVIQETSEDMYSAIDKAVKRAGQSVARRLGRLGARKLSAKMRRSLNSIKQSKPNTMLPYDPAGAPS